MIFIAIPILLNISNALNEKHQFKAEMYVFDETVNRIQYCATACENGKKIQLTHGNSKWNSGILNIHDILQLIVKLLANNIDVINASAGIDRENREKSELVAINRRT